MTLQFVKVIEDIVARPDYERGTPVYLDVRRPGPRSLPDVAQTVVYECENGMELWIDLDADGRALGIEVLPIIG
ncbi:MAG: hypothetical protein AMXMBFR61_04230 [Fimbriimonadales bacterium]